MIYQTKGIVLHKTVFSDNKAIYHVYTRAEGLRSFMVYTSLKKEKKAQWIKMQPLAVVDLKAEHRRNENLDYLRSVELEHSSDINSFDYLKSSVRMFLNELLYRLLQAYPPDDKLFSYIVKSLKEFDEHEFRLDFHMRFMWRMTHYLGCEPVLDFSEKNKYFNLKSAAFTPLDCGVSSELSRWIAVFLQQDLFPENESEVLPANLCNSMLACLIDYYVMHISPSLTKMRSHIILRDVLRN